MIARENVIEMTHVSGATMKMIANPVRLSETPATYRIAPPALGQHTEEVLGAWLGLTVPEIAALHEKGVI